MVSILFRHLLCRRTEFSESTHTRSCALFLPVRTSPIRVQPHKRVYLTPWIELPPNTCFCRAFLGFAALTLSRLGPQRTRSST